MKKYLRGLSSDIPSSIVVVLVAIPLCLGIAVASGVNEFSGIVGGIVGGVVVGLISGSHLSVSGPAAGLTAIVAGAVLKLPAVEAFFLAVVIAGIFQIIMGISKLGVIGDYVPLQSPVCLWVYTKTGVALRNVTVPAADVTTPPAPTTDAMGSAITTGSSMSNSTVDSVTSMSSSAVDTTTSASGPSATSNSAVSSTTDATTSPSPASGAASAAGLNSTVYLLLLAVSFFGVART
ncbi:MAG: hypothetical protein EOO38_29890 [Cytophagaceae bacterium]|nr:MAG: hypothetical protein EOO38_29890 [Cytophagaceae bacterium]